MRQVEHFHELLQWSQHLRQWWSTGTIACGFCSSAVAVCVAPAPVAEFISPSSTVSDPVGASWGRESWSQVSWPGVCWLLPTARKVWGVVYTWPGGHAEISTARSSSGPPWGELCVSDGVAWTWSATCARRVPFACRSSEASAQASVVDEHGETLARGSACGLFVRARSQPCMPLPRSGSTAALVPMVKYTAREAGHTMQVSQRRVVELARA